jgi:hypothetical protein
VSSRRPRPPSDQPTDSAKRPPPPPPRQPWYNTSLPLAARVSALVAALADGEKPGQLSTDAPAVPRLRLPAYGYWSEAAHGVAWAGKVRGTLTALLYNTHTNGVVAWAGKATVFPASIGMAASFNVEGARRVGAAVGVEGRAKYNHALAKVQLSPVQPRARQGARVREVLVPHKHLDTEGLVPVAGAHCIEVRVQHRELAVQCGVVGCQREAGCECSAPWLPAAGRQAQAAMQLGSTHPPRHPAPSSLVPPAPRSLASPRLTLLCPALPCPALPWPGLPRPAPPRPAPPRSPPRLAPATLTLARLARRAALGTHTDDHATMAPNMMGT